MHFSCTIRKWPEQRADIDFLNFALSIDPEYQYTITDAVEEFRHFLHERHLLNRPHIPLVIHFEGLNEDAVFAFIICLRHILRREFTVLLDKKPTEQQAPKLPGEGGRHEYN